MTLYGGLVDLRRLAKSSRDKDLDIRQNRPVDLKFERVAAIAILSSRYRVRNDSRKPDEPKVSELGDEKGSEKGETWALL